jgi:hypothetical protein
MRLSLILLIIATMGCSGPIASPAPPDKPAAAVADSADAEAEDGAYAMLLTRQGPGLPWKGAVVEGEWIFDTPTQAGWTAAVLPTPRIEGERRIYQLRYLRLTIEPGACRDPQLRPRLPDRVTVAGDSSETSGCGGPRVVPGSVEDTHWQVLRLGDEPAPKSESPTLLAFASGGGLGGTHACNDVGITSQWSEGGFVHAAPGERSIGGTLVGCPSAAADFGQRFWAAMFTAVSWQRKGNRLRIVFADGSDAQLRLIL